jgi:DNA-nicking Smr family endonuclease
VTLGKMAEFDDEFDKRMQEAYVSGDPETVLRLLGFETADETGGGNSGDAGSTSESRSRGESLNPSAKVFDPILSNSVDDANTCETTPTIDGDAVSEGDFEDEEENLAVSSLCALYPNADKGVICALLAVHNGNANFAASSLAELDSCGALAVENGRTEGSPNLAVAWDSESYAAAIAKFDEQFPSLGSKSDSGLLNLNSGKPYQNGEMLSTAREHRLAELFPWVQAEIVSETVQRSRGDFAAADVLLSTAYPKPKHWDKQQEAKMLAASRASAHCAASSLRTNDYDIHEEESNRRTPTKWVDTGDMLRELYMTKRDAARDEARQRNRFFEQAAVAARAGKGAEAARLGSLGRTANAKMQQLHRDAADAIWKVRNRDPVKDGQLDLHGLHVAEVLERLPGALTEIAKVRLHVRVVTGTGHHSIGGGGTARLRPVVCDLLKESGYMYKEIVDAKTGQIGAYLVTLR